MREEGINRIEYVFNYSGYTSDYKVTSINIWMETING